MTQPSHTPISRKTKYGFSIFFLTGCTIRAGQPIYRVHHPIASITVSPRFSKIVFQVYIITKELSSKCDLAIVIRWNGSLHNGKTFLQCQDTKFFNIKWIHEGRLWSSLHLSLYQYSDDITTRTRTGMPKLLWYTVKVIFNT